MIHSYPWYVADWLTSPTRLMMTSEERGIYRDLLDYCYQDGSIPADESVLRRMIGATDKEWKRSWPAVSKNFTERDGRLFNERASEILPELERWREQKREAGRKSGKVRSNRKRTDVERSFERTLNGRSNENEFPFEPSTSTSTSTSIPQTPSLVRPLTDETYPEFQAACVEAGMGGSTTDWQEAHLEWRRLDFEQRLAAVHGIRERMAKGDALTLKALPQNYLRKRMWQRPIRAEPRERQDSIPVSKTNYNYVPPTPLDDDPSYFEGFEV